MSSFGGFAIRQLGPATVDSPLLSDAAQGDAGLQTIEDDHRILLDDHVRPIDVDDVPSLEVAGPRKKIFFRPSETRVGIVTCGGLCPGLNDVIRGLTMTAHYRYGVSRILGFRYGYRGLVEPHVRDAIELTPDVVSDIHESGGTILGSSRGHHDVGEMADTLARLGINILFVIGGDGTLRGGLAIAKHLRDRNLPISVIGLPKTIDNDILYLDSSFGFMTAYSQAVESILCAHNEARGAPGGIGVVKLMGRHSGFIACHATLATSHVNFTLIPEVPFELEGPQGLLASLHRRLETRQHAVIVVAEGAGQHFFEASKQYDASGNVKLHDIGVWLCDQIRQYFKNVGAETSLKYIDPSYIIRSTPACAADSVYCWRLAQNAVHAAMCGKTDMLIGRWHGRFVHVPIEKAIASRKQVDPHGDLWLSVLESTGQPPVMR